MEAVVIGLAVVLALVNFAWLIVLVRLTEMWDAKQGELLDRINVMANKPPLPWYKTKVKPGEKAPNEVQPRALEEQFADPEYEAVGKIDPGFIERARNIENG
jgi:hypothetical protein